MFKLILKKQLLEIGTFYVRDRKTGKKQTGGKLVGFIFLWLCVAFSLFMAGFGMAYLFGDTFFMIGLDWYYFTLMGLISLALGVFGSVFNTYASIYKAKDNDLLLSMPIKTSSILSAKVFVTFILSMIFSCIFYVPTIIYYYTHVHQTAASVVCTLLMFIVLNIVSSALVCILGYVIALLSYRLQGKSYMTVIITLVLMGGYYYFYFRINKYLSYIAANGEIFAANLKGKAKIVYLLGNAFVGDVKALLLFAAIAIVFFLIVFFILARRYLKIMTTNRGEAKVEYVAEKSIKTRSVQKALVAKEAKRFTKSAVYMLNSGLGVLVAPIFAVAVLIKSDTVMKALTTIDAQIPKLSIMSYIPLIIVVFMMTLSATILITAPSVSLEGKYIWVLKSLPVNTIDILMAKKKFQNMLAVPSVAIASAVCCYAFEVSFDTSIMVVLTSVVYAMFIGSMGLMLNLLMPNLEWKDESVPVKQSMPILILMFGGWALAVAVAALYYYVFRKILDAPENFVMVMFVLFVIAGSLTNRWISTEGVKRWEAL